ncbi:hypothetical protein [Amycolatopsis jiangsuensis]|uniref:Uncharacterized protein n=1 Tax=Amycolatopsis jiangsuensis TaxID=1181879 RepID=A0A840J3A5_9PSEU|nr:hypothetical protein [Amycolatopsis jiangsuensis]MBB4687937.1 hypothetical protein [Amycolatopsis jiangsuensis]
MAVPDSLTRLLCAWRRDIASVPVPMLVDAEHGARLIREAARVHASPDDARTRARNWPV